MLICQIRQDTGFFSNVTTEHSKWIFENVVPARCGWEQNTFTHCYPVPTP